MEEFVWWCVAGLFNILVPLTGARPFGAIPGSADDLRERLAEIRSLRKAGQAPEATRRLIVLWEDLDGVPRPKRIYR